MTQDIIILKKGKIFLNKQIRTLISEIDIITFGIIKSICDLLQKFNKENNINLNAFNGEIYIFNELYS